MGMKCERGFDGGYIVTLGEYKGSKYDGELHQSDAHPFQQC